MRALITGVEGQDGYFLAKQLSEKGYEVFGGHLAKPNLEIACSLVELDVTNLEAVETLLQKINPDIIFHLAGISNVAQAESDSELAQRVNVGGLENVITAVAANPNILIINASSVEIFKNSSVKIKEDSELEGSSVYAKTKLAAFELAKSHRSQGTKITNAILSNHESHLRPTSFVTGKLADGVARISLGIDSQIEFGNINVGRDWSSASDIVSGLVRIAEANFVGDVILASGVTTMLSELIEIAFNSVGIANWQDYVVIREDLVRFESLIKEFDIRKARNVLGWEPVSFADVWMTEMVKFRLLENSKGASNDLK
jgi:GDPmannose 4,6-dehydratase